MVNGGGPYSLINAGLGAFLGMKIKDSKYKKFGRTNAEGREFYYKELDGVVNQLYNVTSLAVWVPFNEGWGQFDSGKAYAKIRSLDPSRIIDHASGWHDQGHGDLNSLHVYFKKIKVKADHRPFVMSEFGGYSYKYLEHSFNLTKTFGYKKFQSHEEYAAAYKRLYEEEIIANIPLGMAAGVYTQVSDVEDETNGLFTYDRKVVKLDTEFVRSINDKVRL
jgi:hypothetical protein